MFKFITRWTKTEHKRACEALSAYIDGQLTPRERSRVEQHLKKCVACREELESLQQTVTLLHSVPVVKLPRSFSLPVSEVRQQQQVQRRRLAYLYLQGATAVATVLLVLVVSGDALLHYQASRFAYSTRETRQAVPGVMIAPTTLASQAVKGAPNMSLQGSPEALVLATPAQAVAAAQASPMASVLQQSPEMPTPAAPPQPFGIQEAGATETAQALLAEQVPAPKAAPSQVSGRLAASPAPALAATGVETSTVESLSAAEATETALTPAASLPLVLLLVPADTPVPSTATPMPSSTPAPPTAMPSPTSTPVPPSPTPLPSSTPVLVAKIASPQPEGSRVRDTGQLPVSMPVPWWAFLEPLRPVLTWMELALLVVVLMLLVIMLLFRRGQRRT